MTSEDTCDGQPKGYSHCRGKKVRYNHRLEPGGHPTPIPHSEKKVKQRKAQKKKQLFKGMMNGHVAYLEKNGWFNDENKEEVIDNSSFSVMHSYHRALPLSYGVVLTIHMVEKVNCIYQM